MLHVFMEQTHLHVCTFNTRQSLGRTEIYLSVELLQEGGEKGVCWQPST